MRLAVAVLALGATAGCGRSFELLGPPDGGGVGDDGAALEAGTPIPDEGMEVPDGTPPCGPGRVRCGGVCADRETDPQHCGRCGRSCPVDDRAVAVCIGGDCAQVCRPGFDDCNGDLAGGGDGCETALATDVDHCGACGRACAFPNAAAACSGNRCLLTSCSLGYGDCNRDPDDGCEVDHLIDGEACGLCGRPCGPGETCSGGRCVGPSTGEDCGQRIPLHPGRQVVDWEAERLDEARVLPAACDGVSSFAPTAPDVVFEVVPTAPRELIEVAIDKAPQTRHILVASEEPCGVLDPAVACVSTFTEDRVTLRVVGRRGVPVFLYYVDTASGDAMSSPAVIDVAATDCEAVVSVARPEPPSGSRLSHAAPELRLIFTRPIDPTRGEVTLARSSGGTLTYELAAEPLALRFESPRVLRLAPGILFDPGETLTLSWSGLQELYCASPVPPPVGAGAVYGVAR